MSYDKEQLDAEDALTGALLEIQTKLLEVNRHSEHAALVSMYLKYLDSEELSLRITSKLGYLLKEGLLGLWKAYAGEPVDENDPYVQTDLENEYRERHEVGTMLLCEVLKAEHRLLLRQLYVRKRAELQNK